MRLYPAARGHKRRLRRLREDGAPALLLLALKIAATGMEETVCARLRGRQRSAQNVLARASSSRSKYHNAFAS